MPFCPAGGREAVTPTVGVGPVPGRTGCGPVPWRAGMGPLPVRPPPAWPGLTDPHPILPPAPAALTGAHRPRAHRPGVPRAGAHRAGVPRGGRLVVAGESRRRAEPSRPAAFAAALLAAEARVSAARPRPRVRPWPAVRARPGTGAGGGRDVIER